LRVPAQWQVAVLCLHAASAGHATKAAYSCVRQVYMLQSTKLALRNFRELRKAEVRRIPLLRRWVNGGKKRRGRGCYEPQTLS
jgi:hypothetical protein